MTPEPSVEQKDDAIPEPEADAVLTAFSQADLLTLQLRESQIETARWRHLHAIAEAAYADEHCRRLLVEADKVRLERHLRIAEEKNSKTIAERALLGFQQHLETTYGIQDFSKITFDDVTGAFHQDVTEPEPMTGTQPVT